MTRPRATNDCRYCGVEFVKTFTKQLICTRDCAFWARVVKAEGCWGWSGAKHISGYGEFRFARETHRAHRVSYEMHHGPIPDGMHVAHRCDNPPCTNPTHLFLATHEGNMADMARKLRTGRAKLTPEQINDARTRLAAGESQWSIARRLGVWQGTISAIKRGTNWSHIA